MWRSQRILTLAVLGLILSIQSLAAQGGRRGLVELPREGTRHGFWIAGGLGYGQEQYRFEGGEFSDGLGKPTFALRLGGTPDQRVRLGGEVTVWANPYTDDEGFNITETLSSLTMIGQFYPMRTAGLFLKGGAGLGISAASVEGGNGTTETGFVLNFGAGYDIPLGRTLAITPTVEMFRHRFTQRDQPTLHERLFHIGIALTFQR
ncbi:MAG TPA: hypothetical protein VMK53_00620 [Gemmatimonadales bacterium]|nr:hypothetical protein [Gemmatimonadales bacterium]